MRKFFLEQDKGVLQKIAGKQFSAGSFVWIGFILVYGY